MHLHVFCPKETFVVGGFLRSGTTAMMQALEAGGLHVDRDPEPGVLRDHYELNREQRQQGWEPEWLPNGRRFPYAHQGHLIKGLIGASRRMDLMDHGLKVIFMVRDVREVAESATRQFNVPYGADSIAAVRDEELARWYIRPDTEIEVVDFAELVSQPLEVFYRLKDLLGLPINARKAAKLIDPARPTVRVAA